jgi:hypothetical protein
VLTDVENDSNTRVSTQGFLTRFESRLWFQKVMVNNKDEKMRVKSQLEFGLRVSTQLSDSLSTHN